MKDIIYLVTERDGEERADVFTSWPEVFGFTFSPVVRVSACLTINHTHGKTYRERQANAHNLAVQFSNHQAPGLSWSEVATISESFEKLGKRCGLLREFRENGLI